MRAVFREPRLALALVTIAGQGCTTAFWVLLWISVLSQCFTSANAQNARVTTQNVTVPLSSDRMVFTPFLCDTADMIVKSKECEGAWFTTDIPGSSSAGVMTFGRNATDPEDPIPQMFFQFRASTLYLDFLPGMNASINVTLSSNDITITRTLQSSTDLATIVNLPQDHITTLAITVLPSSEFVQFGLQSLVIVVPGDAASTSILPSLTLPPPSPVSTWFSPSSTSFATSTITMPATMEPNSKATLIRYAAGITLGVGLGVPSIVALGFFWWKRRRRKANTANSMPDSFLPEMDDARR